MAIGTLVPTIRVCITDNCSKIKVYDTTSAYSTSNTGGYGTTNIKADTVDSASISYTVTGNLIPTVIDVSTTVQAQDTVVGEFLVAEITIDPLDGEYSFLYSIVDGVTTKTYSTSIYNLCSVRCCVDKLWVKAANGSTSDCDCGCSDGKKTDYSTKAMTAEATYMAIVNGVSCANTTTRDNLLKKLQRICKLENCNCQ